MPKAFSSLLKSVFIRVIRGSILLFFNSFPQGSERENREQDFTSNNNKKQKLHIW